MACLNPILGAGAGSTAPSKRRELVGWKERTAARFEVEEVSYKTAHS